jgi:hypothetical protein
VLSSIIIWSKTRSPVHLDGSNTLTKRQAISILKSAYDFPELKLLPESLKDEKWNFLTESPDIFKNNRYLIGLWFPEELCEACYSEELELFKHFSDVIGYDRALLITNSQNPRIVMTFRKSNKIRFPILSLYDKAGIETPGHSPILFLLDRNFQLEVPVKVDIGSKNIMETYFAFVSELLDLPYN